MIKEISFLVSNACMIAIICSCARMFYTVNPDDRMKHRIVGIGYYLLNSILFFVFQIAWLNICSNLIGLFLYNLVSVKSLKKNILITLLLYVMGMGCDILSVLLLQGYQDGQTVSMASPIISVFLLLICRYLITRVALYFQKAEEVSEGVLLVVPICSVLMIAILMYGENSLQGNVLYVGGGLLIINFAILWLYNRLCFYWKEKYNHDVLEQQLQSYARQLEVIEQSQNQIRHLRHDMKHHLGELRFFTEKKDLSALQNYLSDLEKEMHGAATAIDSGNMAIDSVLNYWIEQAKKELVEVHSTIQIPKSIEQMADVNVILGNLLENAVHASGNSEQKYLDVEIRYDKNVLKIKVENSYRGQIRKEGKRFLSTKTEYGEHGLGLQSVEQIVKKHHGEMEIYAEERFCVKIMFFISM